MKIGGPEGPGKVIPPLPAEEPASPAKVDGPRFAEALAPAAPAAAPAETAPFAEISAKLRAGEISAPQAAELLVDAIVRGQVSAAAPELQERLRTALRQLIEQDPILAAKVRALAEER